MTTSHSPVDVWLCDLTHTKQTIASNTIPLAIGLVASYVKKRLGDRVSIRLFKYPEKLIENLLLKPPRVLGFSNYVWNLDLSYSLASKAKALSPETIIICGGPNYPKDAAEQETFLQHRNLIDFYLYREGEPGLLSLLQALMAHNFDIRETKKAGLPNCHFLADGKLQALNSNVRINLNDIPSPYTTGLLDEFFDGKLMPLVQTNRGCPFSCTFCAESDPFFDKVSFRPPAEVIGELEYIARKVQGNKNIFIADSNFGMYPQDLEIAKGIAGVHEKSGFPDYIHVATGKNAKERVLEAARLTGGLFRLSASVQSTDPQVLKNIKRRNIPPETIISLAQTAAQIGSNTYAEVILALPGDSKEAHFKSLEDVINANLNYIRSFTLMLLKGTELDSPETVARFGLITKYRVLPRCYGVYQFGEDKVLSVETEKVCVASNTLTFDDYLECRLFALTLEIFYNDAVLAELLAFLGAYGIRPFEFLKRIHDRRTAFPGALQEMYNNFLRETREELWDSEEQLLAFAKQEQVIQKYVDGEYGSNLIFKYKALSFLKHMAAIHQAALETAAEIIEEKEVEQPKAALDFLRELMRYSLLRKNNLLETAPSYEETFTYDLAAAAAGGFQGQPGKWKLPDPERLRFSHDRQQQEIMNGHIQEYGLSIVGIGRILSRVHLKKMYRQVAAVTG
ncbi:MAG: radical SAM protein [Deltaproteobacteria bacterium]|nr:MAG: radical SAM protein [Deltaproteobacteria bacterium]